MRGSLPLALLGLSLCSSCSAGCTQSRAEIAWRDGYRAERAGKLEEARRFYEDSVSRVGTPVGAEVNLALLDGRDPEQREAARKRLAKAARGHGDDAEVTARWGLWLLAEGKRDDARAQCESARRKAPALRLARACLGLLANLEERWADSAELLGGAVGDDAPASVLVAAAFAALHVGRPELAQGAVSVLAKVAPESSRRLHAIAWLEASRGHWGEARDAAVRALAAFPREAELAVLLALVERRAGHRAESETAVRKALVASPERRDARHLLGVLLYERGAFSEALALLHALSAPPAAPDARVSFHLGLCQLRLGRLVEARASFAQAAALDPSLAAARRNMDALASFE